MTDPIEIIRPEDAAQTLAAVRAALDGGTALEIVGAGSKRGLGRPVQAPCRLDLSRLSGITLYEPEELVLSARAGTPLAEIETVLAAHGQQLAFEPPDLGPVYGAAPGRATIGGVLAGNLSGPRRFKAGAARDHFLGFAAVSGRGEVCKAGGRVVKNVTGYDLPKLLAGSFGTLAVMTEVTVKVLPAPEQTRTLLIHGLDETAAVQAMTRALRSAHDVSGAAHLPARVAGSHRSGWGGPVTALRLEGFGPSVACRCARLREVLAGFGDMTVLEDEASREIWQAVRDVRLLIDPPVTGRPDRLLWKLSVPPAEGARVLADIARVLPAGDAVLDGGGGLIWLALDPSPDAGQVAVRGAVARTGGHAILVRAPQTVRLAVPVFQPQPEPLARLSRRVKDSFDPLHLLNPGRMAADRPATEAGGASF